MKKVLLLAILVVLGFCPAGQALDHYEFSAVLKKNDIALNLNGSGIRKKVVVPIYAAGLYLEEKCSDHKAIINADRPMAIRLHIISRLIKPKMFIDHTLAGFERSTNGRMAPLQERIDKIMAVFEAGIERGDIYDMVYVPDKGVDFYKNDKYVTTVKGLDLKQALFGVWLVENPYHASVELRNGMLGI